MNNEQGSFIHLLGSMILPKVQMIALGISFFGVILFLMGNEGAETILIAGLSTLAACYFLMANIPPQTPTDVKPSHYLFLVYKLVYIALAIAVIGILFSILKLEGADLMLLSGCGALTLGVLISAITIIINHDNLIVLKNPLIKEVALLIISIYSERN